MEEEDGTDTCGGSEKVGDPVGHCGQIRHIVPGFISYGLTAHCISIVVQARPIFGATEWTCLLEGKNQIHGSYVQKMLDFWVESTYESMFDVMGGFSNVTNLAKTATQE